MDDIPGWVYDIESQDDTGLNMSKLF